MQKSLKTENLNSDSERKDDAALHLPLASRALYAATEKIVLSFLAAQDLRLFSTAGKTITAIVDHFLKTAATLHFRAVFFDSSVLLWATRTGNLRSIWFLSFPPGVRELALANRRSLQTAVVR